MDVLYANYEEVAMHISHMVLLHIRHTEEFHQAFQAAKLEW